MNKNTKLFILLAGVILVALYACNGLFIQNNNQANAGTGVLNWQELISITGGAGEGTCGHDENGCAGLKGCPCKSANVAPFYSRIYKGATTIVTNTGNKAKKNASSVLCYADYWCSFDTDMLGYTCGETDGGCKVTEPADLSKLCVIYFSWEDDPDSPVKNKSFEEEADCQDP
ncbi:MAG: hypothetical protein FWH27_06265 [Planctomycetaceae bacterium]|nr:hypothetical protein [Planctomycetaceae bacterium]